MYPVVTESASSVLALPPTDTSATFPFIDSTTQFVYSDSLYHLLHPRAVTVLTMLSSFITHSPKIRGVGVGVVRKSVSFLRTPFLSGPVC